MQYFGQYNNFVGMFSKNLSRSYPNNIAAGAAVTIIMYVVKVFCLWRQSTNRTMCLCQVFFQSRIICITVHPSLQQITKCRNPRPTENILWPKSYTSISSISCITNSRISLHTPQSYKGNDGTRMMLQILSAKHSWRRTVHVGVSYSCYEYTGKGIDLTRFGWSLSYNLHHPWHKSPI